MSLFSGLFGFFNSFFGFRLVGSNDDDSLVRFFGGRTNGRDGNDTIIGGFFNDRIKGGAGDDLIRARSGDDVLIGGEGDDDLRAGRGDDRLIGGSDDDHLKGGRGADKFVFDPSNPNEGHDVIKDLDPGAGDRIVLNAADVLRSAPGVASASPFGDPGAVEGADLDEDPGWAISESPDGDVVVEHPGGKITIEGLAFSEDLRFADLLPAIEIANAQAGDEGDNRLRGGRDDDFLDGRDGDDHLIGRRGDDLLLGGAGEDDLYGGRGDDLLVGGLDDDYLNGGRGNDILEGGSGDDHLRGGGWVDRFVFDPSNLDEGADVIEDFELGVDLLSLSAADIAKATPEVLAKLVAGDASDIASAADLLTALDNSAAWDIFGAAGSNNLTVEHPGGTIELEGLGFAGQSFVDLAPVFDADALNLQNGDDGANSLTGGRGDDLLNGGAGLDLLVGDNDDDLLVGGAGADLFRFDPSNGNEGNDLIADFNPAEDKIQLFAEDVIDSLEEDLTLDGLQLDDLDDSANWSFSAVDGGDATITHSGGTIALAGLGTALAGVTSFNDLSGAIDIV